MLKRTSIFFVGLLLVVSAVGADPTTTDTPIIGTATKDITYLLDTKYKDANYKDELYSLSYANAAIATGTTGMVSLEEGGSISTGSKVATYTAEVATLEQYARDIQKVIDTENSKVNISDAEKDYVKYLKPQLGLLNVKIAKYKAGLFPEQNAPAVGLDEKEKTYTAAIKTTKATYDVTFAKASTDDKKGIDAINEKLNDVKVTPIEPATVMLGAPDCDTKTVKKADCETANQKYIDDLLKTGKAPKRLNVKLEKGDICTINKAMKDVGVLMAFMDPICDAKVSKKGLGDSGALKCAVFSSTMLGSSPLTDRRLATLDASFLTSTSGAGTSLALGNLAQNPFATTTADKTTTTTSTATSTSTAASNVVLSSITDPATTVNTASTGITAGSDGHLNTSSALSFLDTSVYNISAAKQSAASITNSNSLYAAALANLSGYNSAMKSYISAANPKIAETYQTSATGVQNTVAKISGYNTSTYNQGLAMNEEITSLNTQLTGILSAASANRDKIATCKIRMLLGGDKDSFQAASDLIDATAYGELLKIQAGTIQSTMGIYTTVLGGHTSMIDQYYMYADNNQAVGQRSIKLKDLKTPVNGGLKDGWEKVLKNHINDLLQKAEQAKRNMNEAKQKLRDALAKKVNIIPPEKLPSFYVVTTEVSNIMSLKDAALKNMQAIDKAMSYHSNKRDVIPKEQYAQYEAESQALKGAMTNLVKTVDDSKPDITKAQSLLTNLYLEMPQTEALRAYAKKMVQEGK